LVLRASHVERAALPVLRKATEISLEATSGFATGEANGGDVSVRTGKANTGIPVYQVSFSLKATRKVAILCIEYVNL
jgi:hypothetical protein